MKIKALKIKATFGASAIIPVLFIVALANSAAQAETGTLKMRLVYAGGPVDHPAIDVNKDVEFCGKHGLKQETLVVNEVNNGIKNAVVYVYTGRGGSKLEEFEPVKATHTLANLNCRFEPRIVIGQVGDTLKVTNPDTVGHNANINFFRNKPQNMMVPNNGSQSFELEEAEPAAIPVECNIHPWMKAYVLVLEHPFAAVSDDDGMIEIEGLPTGEELTFRIFHEAGKIDEVTIGGKKEKWSRSKFELDIKSGMNDLGEVVVPKEALEP